MDSPRSEQPGAGRPRPGRRSRWVVVTLGASLVVVVLAVTALEIAPRPLAAALIRDWLRAQGAPASITITALSDRGMTARLTVGDPRDPDLSIDRMEVVYVLTGPWNGQALAFTPRSVRLVRPRLKLRLVNGNPDFGALNGVVRWVRSQPPSRQPMPDLLIEDGGVLIRTPGGDLRLVAGGTLRGGRSGALTGRLEPFRQRVGDLVLASTGGPLRLVGDGRRVTGDIALGPTTAQSSGRRFDAAVLSLALDGPSPDASGRGRGPARLDFTAGGVKASNESVVGESGSLKASLSGMLDATADRQTFRGTMSGDGGLAEASGSGLAVRNLATIVSLQSLVLAHDGKGVSGQARGQIRLSLAQLATGQATFSDISAEIALAKGWLRARVGGAAGVGASLRGRLAGRGAVVQAVASRMAAALPVVSGERPYAKALTAALRDFRVSAPDWRLELGGEGERLILAAPARLDTASGAALTVSGRAEVTGAQSWRAAGSGSLALSGGDLPPSTLALDSWSATPTAAQARLAVQSRFSFGPVEDAAMNVRVHMRGAANHLQVDLDGCGPITAARLGSGDQVVKGASMRLCPGAGSLIEFDHTRWSAHGRIEALRGDAPSPAIGLREAALGFDAEGSSTGPKTADLRLVRASLADQSDPVRFAPVGVSGALALDRGAWRGGFLVASAAGKRIGTIKVAHSQEDGAGRADIDIDGLDFTPGQWQPADLTPLAASASGASGHAGFTGWFSWTGKGEISSAGVLEAKALGFASPLGRVENLNTLVRFTSLTPPITSTGQTVTVAAIQTVTPVTDLRITFSLDEKAFHAESMTAAFAGGTLGLEPVSLPFAADGKIESAMVLHRVNIGTILDASNLSDKIKVQAKVDGRIPFTLGPSGLTVRHGSLTAIAGGRLSISRSAFEGAAATPSTPATSATPAAPTSFAQDFAYQAMENLSFDTLDATLNSQDHDRLGILFHIKGRHDPPTPKRAVFGLLDLLQGKALSKPVPLPSGTQIDLTLDSSLNFGELVTTLEAAWRDAIAPIRLALPAGGVQRAKSPETTERRTEHP